MLQLIILLDNVVTLCFDDAFQIIQVDMALDNDQRIGNVARIGEDNLIGKLTVTVYERRQMFPTALVSHDFLIVVDLVKIL